MYGRGHMRNGRSTEQSWTPPADYLAEQAARIAELEQEQEERERAEIAALAARLREAAAWWHETTTDTDEEEIN